MMMMMMTPVGENIIPQGSGCFGSLQPWGCPVRKRAIHLDTLSLFQTLVSHAFRPDLTGSIFYG